MLYKLILKFTKRPLVTIENSAP